MNRGNHLERSVFMSSSESRSRSRFVRFIALGALLSPAFAAADDTHYQDFTVGGRGVALGGAFTAIADDPSGLYYNPAGIADVKSNDLQVSSSLYGFERGAIGKDLTLPVPGMENRQLQFTDLLIVPSSAGFVHTFGRLNAERLSTEALGVSVLVPSYRSFRVTSSEEVDGYSASYQRRVTDRELWSGIGYARKFGDNLRLGVSVHYILRSVLDTENVTVSEHLDELGDKFQSVVSDISLLNGSVLLALGGKLHLSEALSVGASVRSPSWLVHSLVNLHYSRAASDPTATTAARSSLDSLDAKDAKSNTAYAPSLRVGFAWSRKYRYTIAGDLEAHAPTAYTLIEVDDTYRRRLPFAPNVRRSPVVNFNFGGEFLIIREVSIAGGIFSDFSSASSIKAQPAADQPAHVDLLGFSAALGYFGRHTLSRLGVMYSFGKGHDVVPEKGDVTRLLEKNQSFRRVDYFQSFFYVFISSSFRY